MLQAERTMSDETLPRSGLGSPVAPLIAAESSDRSGRNHVLRVTIGSVGVTALHGDFDHAIVADQERSECDPSFLITSVVGGGASVSNVVAVDVTDNTLDSMVIKRGSSTTILIRSAPDTRVGDNKDCGCSTSSGASSGTGSDDESGISPSPRAGVRLDERSTSGASSGSGSDDESSPPVSGAFGYDTFHMNELDSVIQQVKDENATVTELNEDVVIDEKAAILSRQGTIRGVKNLVRASIKCLTDKQSGKRDYTREERNRIVLYTTSMGVVRKTFEACRRARCILQTLLVRFEERDVFMNRTFQKEIQERLGLDRVVVPHMFVEGDHVGGAEIIERLNESGELRQMLKPYKRTTIGRPCGVCGGFQYLPCPTCGGSKKSAVHRHRFTTATVYLRCQVCDEGGLIRCTSCVNGEVP